VRNDKFYYAVSRKWKCKYQDKKMRLYSPKERFRNLKTKWESENQDSRPAEPKIEDTRPKEMLLEEN